MQQAPKKPTPLSYSLPPLQSPEIMLGALEESVFGKIPELSNVEILDVRTVSQNAFIKGDAVTEWKVSAGYGARNNVFHIVLIANQGKADAPYIVMQNFCPNTATVPIAGITPPAGSYFDCSDDGIMASIFGYFFGRYITVPPYEMILQRGYNIAMMYPSEFVPDNKDAAPVVINTLFKNQEERTGTLAIWASLSTWLAGELKVRTDTKKIIAYGHSRYGKTALIAGATSQDIDGVIAHQSGTGGASLLRGHKGESIESIMQNYPHWFSPEFSKFALDTEKLSIDAHSLLALIAPKPLLLGNARRDVWSDPEGAFSAAQAASPSWQNFGKKGLTATRLDEFKAEDDIAFWMRPGTHGVVKEDWPAFLDFIDAHFSQ